MPHPPRPQKVTSACLFVGISSALLLFYVIGWLTSWNSQEIQGGLRDALADADLAAVGLTVQGTIDALRTVLMVSVVPLVAGVVFAVYAARGHAQSRVMLTGVAALAALAFVLTGGLIGLLPAAFAVFAVVQLWSRESRVWFAVVNGREVPASLVPVAVDASARPDPFATTTAGVGAQVPEPPATPAQVQPHHGPPSPVRTLTLVTSIAAGIASAVGAAYVAVYLLAREPLTQAQLDSPMRTMMDNSDAEIVEAMRVAAVVCAITVILGMAAMIATWLIWKQRGIGRVALTVLSGVTVVMGLFTLVGLPWAGAAVWVLVLLRRPETRAWVSSS